MQIKPVSAIISAAIVLGVVLCLVAASVDAPPTILFACVAVVLIAAASYRYPQILIAALLYVGVFKPRAATGISLSDPTLIVIVMLAVAIGIDLLLTFAGRQYSDLRERFSGQSTGVVLFLLFLSILAISYLYTPSPVAGWAKLSRFAVFESLAFFAPFVLFKSSRDFRVFLWAAVIVAVPLSTRVIVGMLHPSAEQLLREADLTMIGEGNIIGTALLILLFYRFPGQWGRRLPIALIPLLALGLVASQARGPAFSFIIASLLCVSVIRVQTVVSRKAILAGMILTGAAFALSFLWISALPGYAVRGEQKRSEVQALLSGKLDAGGTTSIRLSYYKSSIDNFLEQPLTGVGLNGWTLYYFGEDRLYYPHNFVLEVAAEQGLPGVTILVVLFVAAFAGLFKAARAGYREFLLAIPVLLFSVIYNSVTGTVENRLLFFWLGTAFVVARMARQQHLATSHRDAPDLQYFASEPLPYQQSRSH